MIRFWYWRTRPAGIGDSSQTCWIILPCTTRCDNRSLSGSTEDTFFFFGTVNVVIINRKKKKKRKHIDQQSPLKHLCLTVAARRYSTRPLSLRALSTGPNWPIDGSYSQPTKDSGITWLVYRSLLHLQKKYCCVSIYWLYATVCTDQQHLLLKAGCWLCRASLHPRYRRDFALEYGLVPAALPGSGSCSTSKHFCFNC